MGIETLKVEYYSNHKKLWHNNSHLQIKRHINLVLTSNLLERCTESTSTSVISFDRSEENAALDTSADNALQMDNLAPPPYRSQDSTPQILDIRNHLQTLLHTHLSFKGESFTGTTQRASLQQQVVGDFNNMKTKSYLNETQKLRSTIETGSRNEEPRASEDADYYKSTDPITLDYLTTHNSYIPFSINTVHLQNPYKQSLPLEGYAPKRVGLKGMYRARESNVRPRRNSFATRRREENVPGAVDINYLKDNDKAARRRDHRDECHLCLKKNEIGVTAQQYCLTSTLHGLRYVGDSSLSILERLFWIVSFITAVLTAAYYIWNLFQKWTDSPMIISLSPEPLPLVEIPFPSITVCNMNNAKRTEAERINQGRENLEKLLLNDICNFENGTSSSDLDSESGKWSNVQRFMINVTQPCTDMLYLCQWHENTTDCEKIFNPTLTDEGICCNFNAVHRKYLFFNPRDLSDLNVTFPFGSVDWTPEKGYSPSTPTDSIPWRPYGAGRHLGLTLVLDAEIYEYYCSSTASVGFKMLLHNPVETPKIADFAFAITPGEETRIVIRPTINSASKSIIRLPRKKRRCFFTSERSLRYYRTYTQRNCILECEANFTQQICNCVQHYMPKSNTTKICGKKDERCANQARLAMELKLYDDDNTTSSLVNASQTRSCNCWPGCYEISYNSELSQSKLVSTFDVNSEYVKKNSGYFVENIAVVHLYFVDSQFTMFVKNELFGFTELLSNTGGLLGLFMGFSFLSLVEIIYFVTLRLWCRIHRQKASPTHTLLRVVPAANQNANVYPFAQ